MSRADSIRDIISEKYSDIISDVYISDVAEVIIIGVWLSKVRERSGSGYTSKRQLAYLANKIENITRLRVILSYKNDVRIDDIEAGLRAVIKGGLSEVKFYVRTTFNDANLASVLIVLQERVEAEVISDVRAQAEQYFHSVKVGVGGFDVIQPATSGPSMPQILRSIKLHAPITLERLLDVLSEDGGERPSERWLSNSLDKMRRKNLLVRNGNGSYALTYAGLAIVPVTRSRNSSDIMRLMLLARRKVW